jgi:hypothetical protein
MHGAVCSVAAPNRAPCFSHPTSAILERGGGRHPTPFLFNSSLKGQRELSLTDLGRSRRLMKLSHISSEMVTRSPERPIAQGVRDFHSQKRVECPHSRMESQHTTVPWQDVDQGTLVDKQQLPGSRSCRLEADQLWPLRRAPPVGQGSQMALRPFHPTC